MAKYTGAITITLKTNRPMSTDDRERVADLVGEFIEITLGEMNRAEELPQLTERPQIMVAAATAWP